MLCAAPWVVAPSRAAAQDALPDAVGRLWSERDPGRRAEAARVVAGFPFRAVFDALSAGPVYSGQAPVGVRHASHHLDGEEYQFSVVIPDSYRSGVASPVRVMLHGGVSTDDRRRGSKGSLENLRRSSEVTVLPSSWRDRPWWGGDQVRSVSRIVKEIRREYNLDENRTHIAGISDGGTGAYFFAMKDPTPWSAFLPLIGHVAVLRSVTREPLHLENLRARPFFAVNTGQDPLYPHDRVLPYVETLQEGGVTLDYRAEPDFGHNTNWWPGQRENMARFLADHPRDPHPPSVDWAAESREFPRLHWVVIRALGAVDGEAEFDDWNEHQGESFFTRPSPPGRVRAERERNTIRLSTRGVRRVEAPAIALGLRFQS